MIYFQIPLYVFIFLQKKIREKFSISENNIISVEVAKVLTWYILFLEMLKISKMDFSKGKKYCKRKY
jgi:hypothetical protein